MFTVLPEEILNGTISQIIAKLNKLKKDSSNKGMVNIRIVPTNYPGIMYTVFEVVDSNERG